MGAVRAAGTDCTDRGRHTPRGERSPGCGARALVAVSRARKRARRATDGGCLAASSACAPRALGCVTARYALSARSFKPFVANRARQQTRRLLAAEGAP
jgi:hypothetical protein